MMLNPVPGGWVNAELMGFETLSQTLVDDELWYTIRTHNAKIAAWLRDQCSTQRYEYGGSPTRYGNMFDVRADLYVILTLKWA